MQRFWPTLFCFLCFINIALADDDFEFGIIFPKAEIINEHTARIPFKLIDHLIVIEAQILDKNGNFIIDTGSEALILNQAHFPNTYPFYKKRQETSGVIGNIDGSMERKVEEFFIKTLSLQNKVSDIIDLSHIEKSKRMNLLGIIGFDILKDYEVFIDLYLNQITLSKVDANGDKLDKNIYLEKITDSVDFKLKSHSIVIKADLNGETLSFALDSAAELNQINSSVNKKALKYFIPTKRLKLNGASKRNVEVLAGKLHRVKLNDDVYFGPMYTILTNLSQLKQAFGVNIDGIFGYEFLKQKRTIINYQKEKLYFVAMPVTSP